MLYSARRGIVWILKLAVVVVVLTYVIPGCTAKHPELVGPARPVPVNADDDVAGTSSAQHH